uniref:YgiT-type zinc finger domain-containing protein n=1 Tax=Candidatus Kentrum sp. LFY TaxID=2126342 RepID=A0A450UWV0_9GAMM|nr:MAG: YgiT-type zinc finger domain-containing protein [Candidatus Kentron sp. LFY]
MNTLGNPCPICHGGRKQAGITSFTVDLGFGVVVVRGVPAQVCDLCGSDWIEDSATERLEAIVDQARREQPIVKVTNWPDKVSAWDT